MAAMGLMTAWSRSAHAAPPTAVNDSYGTPHGTPLVVGASAGVLANDTDPDHDPLTAMLQKTTSSGTLQLSSNGSFTYTPNRDFSGKDTFTYHARDATRQSNTATVTITVASDVAPVAANDSYSTTQGTPLTVGSGNGVLANDTDANGDSLTAAQVGNVAHGTLALSPNGSFTYSPAPGYAGADSFTYRANDGSLNSNTATVSIMVTTVDGAPVAANDAYSTAKNTPLSVPAKGVLTNDTDPDGDALTAALVAIPLHGVVVLSANGSFTYAPATGYTGADAFTYRASDGTLNSNTAAVAITVTAVNNPPVAAADSYSTNEDTPLNVTGKGVLTNDTDPDGDTLVATLGANVAHGTLTLSSNGSFVYTPAANYNGSDSFTYSASDGKLNSNTVTVSITIVPVNDAPVAVADSYTTVESTPLAVPAKGVLANDTDAEGDPLTAVLVAGPAHGTVALNADGSFTYTSTLHYNGPDTFTYRANDGKLNSDPATVTITVTPAPHVDLSLALAATPNPVVLGAQATWTFSIKNNTPSVDVSGVTLTATFAGEVPFQFDAPSDSGCTLSVVGSATQLSCTLGAVAATMTRTLALTGHGSFAGDVFANAQVAVMGPVPVDATPANDKTTTALSVAQIVSSGPAQVLQGVDARALAAGDFNGDGFVDLAVATGPDQGTGVFLNVVDPANANRRVLSSLPISVGAIAPSNAIAVADFNADHNSRHRDRRRRGDPEPRLLNSGPAAFTAADVGDASEDSHAVAVGDVNGDGLPDIVFANYGPTSVYLNRGSGVFELSAKVGTANSRGAVLVDLFGDTLPELVLANANGDATVYRNTAGAFTLEVTLPTGPTTSVGDGGLQRRSARRPRFRARYFHSARDTECPGLAQHVHDVRQLLPRRPARRVAERRSRNRGFRSRRTAPTSSSSTKRARTRSTQTPAPRAARSTCSRNSSAAAARSPPRVESSASTTAWTSRSAARTVSRSSTTTAPATSAAATLPRRRSRARLGRSHADRRRHLHRRRRDRHGLPRRRPDRQDRHDQRREYRRGRQLHRHL